MRVYSRNKKRLFCIHYSPANSRLDNHAHIFIFCEKNKHAEMRITRNNNKNNAIIHLFTKCYKYARKPLTIMLVDVYGIKKNPWNRSLQCFQTIEISFFPCTRANLFKLWKNTKKLRMAQQIIIQQEFFIATDKCHTQKLDKSLNTLKASLILTFCHEHKNIIQCHIASRWCH